MPIPPFDGILNVLPPHLGDPTSPSDVSPYPCSVVELCDRFATSADRTKILRGFLQLRACLLNAGLTGFQWIDGSFLEDIESAEGRPPGDIDVVTFIHESISRAEISRASRTVPVLLNRPQLKATYLVDHFLVPLNSPGKAIVDATRYWYGLFSHRRDGLWKGMLTIELADSPSETIAAARLGGGP